MKKLFHFSLVLFVFALTACSGYSSTPKPAAPAGSAPVNPVDVTKVNISNFAFDPLSVTIKVGQTVTWVNQDNVAHTVVADDSSWASDNLQTGAAFSHTFTTAGTFPYHCSIHPSMKGTVVVQP
jgi:plastocyanin